MPYLHRRTIRFADTDAAAVVYFPNYLSICHEAYEQSLMDRGFGLESGCRELGILVPVRRSEADYLRPLLCGESVEIELTPSLEAPDTFSIRFELFKFEGRRKRAAVVRTTHVCIDGRSRERSPLPAVFLDWIQLCPPPAS